MTTLNSHHDHGVSPVSGGAAPQALSGRQYWRSLDQLSKTPEFNQWLEREFPEGASEWTDPVSRRHFVKIMSASFLLAGIGLGGTGCRRPEQKIVPFSRNPEGYVHGVPQFYATAMPTRGAAIPLVVRSNDGRPTKVEGNPGHPEANGGTDRFAQASILNLYDPDRASRFLRAGNVVSPEAAVDFLAQLSKQAAGTQGQGIAFLLDRNNSPSRQRLQAEIAKKMPKTRWHVYEPVDTQVHSRILSAVSGQPVSLVPLYGKAKVILSLDCDFLGTEDNVHNNIRGFTQARRMEKPEDTPNRLYVVESLLTVTGSNADHRLRVPGTAVARVAAAVASALIGQNSSFPKLQKLGQVEGVDAKWIAECAKDLASHKGQCLVVAGHRQPTAVHLLASAMNQALGSYGNTIAVLEGPPTLPEADLAELAKALHAGQVETLIIVGSNPVYTAPAALDWSNAQKRAKTVVRLGYYEDETAPLCTWHLPATHYLESWGDARTSDGTLTPIQPLIAPLFGGMTDLELLARIAGADATSPHEIVRQTFKDFLPGENFEEVWKKVLHDGFVPNTDVKQLGSNFNVAAKAGEFDINGLTLPLAGPDQLDVVFHLDYSLDDGRYSNNGWLQELPDPITKITWDNAILMSRKTAAELKVKSSDVVEVRLGERSVRGPAWIQPGMADYTLGLALGYGRSRTGRVGAKAGFNAYALRNSASEHIARGAKVTRTGQTYPISCTQDHWSMEGRPIIREANLDQYRKHPEFAKKMDAPPAPVHASLYPNPLDKLEPSAFHQWGMSIDLNQCVGCSACVLACQSENNVPIVGKDQVKRGREMHWLRIDRYYAGDPKKRNYTDSYQLDRQQQFEDWIDDPQVLTQPMLCQHCEAAPCENVCPVNATVHDHEGLNVMVYNRCVGTRYCSNNCPYKVRRFNYFDYNKRPIDALYKGPFAKRKDDEWDLLKMIKNPDVTVRMRGVMEKCTFCIQRIESAKISQKVKAGASGDVTVPEGTFTTACAQACPSDAIVFGNLKDPNSRVAKLKQNQRDYSVLDVLYTRPRLTYLARVRNPNPAMPDFREAPLSFEHISDHMGGDPLKHDPTHGARGAQPPSHSGAKGGH